MCIRDSFLMLTSRTMPFEFFTISWKGVVAAAVAAGGVPSHRAAPAWSRPRRRRRRRRCRRLLP
eukprot:4451574-Heterocapsa_arctica.AAC.1